MASEMASEISDALKRAKSCLLAAQQRQKACADRSRVEIKFSPGELVLLNTKNLKFKHSTNVKLARKLLPRVISPFTVETMVGKAAVRLKLPTGSTESIRLSTSRSSTITVPKWVVFFYHLCPC